MQGLLLFMPHICSIKLVRPTFPLCFCHVTRNASRRSSFLPPHVPNFTQGIVVATGSDISDVRLWLATPIGFPEAKWQQVCLLKHRGERRRELPRVEGTASRQPRASPPMQGGDTSPQAKVRYLSQNGYPGLSLSLSSLFSCSRFHRACI